MTSRPPDDFDQDDPEAALREARARFVAGFGQRASAIGLLIDSLAVVGTGGPAGALRQIAHKLAGLAGMVGLPSISAAALDIERLASDPGAAFDAASARAALQTMRAGFAHDLTQPPPSWAVEGGAPPVSARILVVEDDEDQSRLVESGLRAAGYRVSHAGTGRDAITRAKVDNPDLILLDIDLPGLDGHTVCRQLKTDPAVAHIPVVFVTARSGLVDRMAGLTLGADDYVSKPFEPAELLLRVRRLLAPRAPAAQPPAAAPTGAGPQAAPPAPPVMASADVPVLDYATFALTARDAIQHGGAALALVRAEPDHLGTVARALVDELRRKDLAAKYSDTHIVLLMPGQTAAAARDRMAQVIAGLKAGGIDGVAAGVAASADAARGDEARQIETLLGEADLALASARLSGADVAMHGETESSVRRRTTVLIAEDDPDVLHIVDPRLKAAGYRTVIAFDGQQALDAIAESSPDLVLLDLMMPKLTGFQVLARMRELPPPRPRCIVVSARGREDDVTRAFDLGADDYVTKPFNPQELVARIARLLR